MSSSKHIRVRITDEQSMILRANAEQLNVTRSDLARRVARFDVSTNAALREEADLALMAIDKANAARCG